MRAPVLGELVDDAQSPAPEGPGTGAIATLPLPSSATSIVIRSGSAAIRSEIAPVPCRSALVTSSETIRHASMRCGSSSPVAWVATS